MGFGWRWVVREALLDAPVAARGAGVEVGGVGFGVTTSSGGPLRAALVWMTVPLRVPDLMWKGGFFSLHKNS